ncbi:hypothetical protein BST55_23870 [Vibrio vulnificus]|uniref:hypothetical protein n=1 Tax=Vibrio vulnificus TaxID=672 RepID=UPI000B9FA48F|nr:hypothetical protein [Vibrio vulnificus]EGR8992385.1 hypothetical protein [Vibrio vulnificus]EHI9243052.1 hypothetical protein [Vibrio vulnificus]EHZ2656967.1 hypothetical protein [Vibrio vulnificus]MCA0785902.1 hypothetical protein [Vibrio vulnificus]MCA3928885.1 hypothetical protein [Vibrio vulnificus]
MDPTNITKFSNLEKAMSLRWCLTLLAAFSFVDLYLLIKFEFGISDLTTTWLKLNFGVGDLATLVLTFSVTFGIAIPGASHLIIGISSIFFIKVKHYLSERFGFTFHRNEQALDRDPSYARVEDYRRWAIKNANSAAYRDYERTVTEKDEVKFIRYISRCCLLISSFPLLFADVFGIKGLPYLHAFYLLLDSTSWYVEFPVKFGVGCFGLFLFGIGFSDESHYDDYVYLGNHEVGQ